MALWHCGSEALSLWGSAALSLAGVGISGYLAAKRVAGGRLARTRWADCDAVNSSPCALLLGVPLSFLGLAGYLALLALTVAALLTVGATQRRILLLGFLMALGGFGFSTWLTHVETYLIQALCSWRLASAAVITLLTIIDGMGLWQSHPRHPRPHAELPGL